MVMEAQVFRALGANGCPGQLGLIMGDFLEEVTVMEPGAEADVAAGEPRRCSRPGVEAGMACPRELGPARLTPRGPPSPVCPGELIATPTL